MDEGKGKCIKFIALKYINLFLYVILIVYKLHKKYAEGNRIIAGTSQSPVFPS
jgi:hypothetical protein